MARKHVAFAVTAVAALALTACSSNSSSSTSSSSAGSGTPKAGAAVGTLTGAMASGGIDTLDPNRWYFAVTWGLENALCTTLVRYADTEAVKIVPGIANLPVVTDHGLDWTYTLRPGARFSDGQAITPADIKYTYMRVMNPAIDTGTGDYFENVIGAPAYLLGKSKTIAGITTTADSISFHLSSPDGAFLYKSALPTTCPVPVGTPMKPIVNGSLEEKYASGPFKISSYEPSRQLVLVFNKNYDQSLGARGHVAKIVFTIGDEATEATLQIEAGQLDFDTSNLATADIIKISQNKALASQVHVSPEQAITYLFMNYQVPPFNNVDVRKAINYAINRTAILAQWGGPLAGTVTDQIIPIGMQAYKKYSIYPSTPDLAMAKKLMKESGVKTPFTTQLRTQNDAPGFIDMAEVIQSDLKAIGINVQIVGSPNSVNYSYISNPKAHVPMGIQPWGLDFPDPEAVMNAQVDPATPEQPAQMSRWTDPKFISLFNDDIGLTGTARQTAYASLDYQVMSQQAPIAPIFDPRWYDFVSKRLGGYVFSYGSIDYNTLYIK
ncbi:MAG TPA: ABC transporter substrate-binding protein [Streptosporangiaceae bacterium]|jgi:ABC-type transport system substrate-binding protein|nr:ABC transporter substrate-binding protein [Streptosporangiaceae bacterium]